MEREVLVRIHYPLDPGADQVIYTDGSVEGFGTVPMEVTSNYETLRNQWGEAAIMCYQRKSMERVKAVQDLLDGTREARMIEMGMSPEDAKVMSVPMRNTHFQDLAAKEAMESRL